MTFETHSPVGINAVLVVPGIMGSELIDTTDGATIWGVADPGWYVRAWTTGSSLKALRLTDAELGGHYGRVRASRVLRAPAFAPFLQGIEPYTELVRQLRSASIHADAVVEFPYDWRLPVAYNAGLLAAAIRQHLEYWRERVSRLRMERDLPDDDPGVILVAHSMGGLLARHLNLIPGALDDVRTTITLGTPFYGSVKAALMLATGVGTPVPLPRRRLRALAVGLPGLYDLLPSYRCVDLDTDARQLLPGDIAALGGDPDLAAASAVWHSDLAETSLPGHIQVVGTQQPTFQSVFLSNGTLTGLRHTCRPASAGRIERVDVTGDGTVSRESAQLQPKATPLAQSHGALAKASEAILVAKDAVMGNNDRRPWQGETQLGIALPDIVLAGSTIRVPITGATHPRDSTCRVVDVASNRQIGIASITLENGRAIATVEIGRPSLYRVEIYGGGMSGVSEITLATDPIDID